MNSVHVRTVAVYIIVLCTIIALTSGKQVRVRLTQDALFALAPSAERAYAYGSRHLNAAMPDGYDINRAEMYFLEAVRIDPTFPYVFHELARIAFLRGEYELALTRINFQIAQHGESAPKSFYIRGLVEGYMGLYDDAVRDYQHYLSLLDSPSWAGYNDYAWVLLKADQPREAAAAAAKGLKTFPQNPWLLNSLATALYEIGDYEVALSAAETAGLYVEDISDEEWLNAYIGNDPRSVPLGIETFRSAVRGNIHTIQQNIAARAVQ